MRRVWLLSDERWTLGMIERPDGLQLIKWTSFFVITRCSSAFFFLQRINSSRKTWQELFYYHKTTNKTRSGMKRRKKRRNEQGESSLFIYLSIDLSIHASIHLPIPIFLLFEHRDSTSSETLLIIYWHKTNKSWWLTEFSALDLWSDDFQWEKKHGKSSKARARVLPDQKQRHEKRSNLSQG